MDTTNFPREISPVSIRLISETTSVDLRLWTCWDSLRLECSFFGLYVSCLWRVYP